MALLFIVESGVIFHDKTYEDKINEKVTVYWLKGIKIPGQQGYYKDLKGILDSHKYDLIQALDDSQITTVLVSRYCKKRNIKFVLWQGMYENYPEKWKRIIQYFYDWTLLKVLRKNTKYSISKTKSAQSYLTMKNFPKGIVIPVGLEIANFENSKKIDYRKKLGIDKNKKIFLYVGKVEERRKPLFCLELYNKIKKNHDDCCMVYVGKGPMLEEAHKYAKEKDIKDVYFIDQIPQTELPSLYEESDLFILPTRYEIFGMVLMEAMYFGTPVITYKAAGPLDVISNGVDGIVMDDFDINNWTKEIEKYIFEKNTSKEMGQKGQEKIKKEYLWKTIAEKYCKEYLNIIKK